MTFVKDLDLVTVQGVIKMMTIKKIFVSLFYCTCNCFASSRVEEPHLGTLENDDIWFKLWSKEENVFCVEAYILRNPVDETGRHLLKMFGITHHRLEHSPGKKKSVGRWASCFSTTGAVSDSEPSGRSRTARTEENTRRVTESVSQSARWSVRRRSQSPGIKRHNLWQIKKNDVQLHPYRLKVHWESAVHFPSRHISFKTSVPRAQHSTSLSPLDFFLWGYLKDRVHAEKKTHTAEELKSTIVL